jgi:hypothetical protein
MYRFKFYRVCLFLVNPERMQCIIFSSIPRNFCPPPKRKVSFFRVNRIKREADFENSSKKLAIISSQSQKASNFSRILRSLPVSYYFYFSKINRKEIVRLHRVPINIASNRDSRFISKFGKRCSGTTA